MKFFLSILLAALLLTSCEKSIENFDGNPVATADTIWATTNSATLEINQLQQALIRPSVIDSFSLQTGANIQTSNGLRVEIPANAFAGNTTGTAQAEINFLHTKGDFIRFGKPTTSDGMVLQTKGSLYINITKSGQPLALQTGKTLSIVVADSLPTSSMKAYNGEAPSTAGFGVFNWRQNDSLTPLPITSGYQLRSNRQQWLSLASGLDTVSQKSRVVLSMSAIYTNANTLAFIVFKNTASVVQFTPDAGNRIWLAEKIPAGKEVIYVTITKKGSDYWLGTHEMTTAFNQNVHITPQKKSLQAISDFLDTL